MSDFEDKLRSLPFREPPRDLRRRVLAATEDAVARWTWRDWLWPSPLAWAGLAATLAVVMALDTLITPSAPPPQHTASPEPTSAFFAFQARQAALQEIRF
jgi:hypothetical protein